MRIYDKKFTIMYKKPLMDNELKELLCAPEEDDLVRNFYRK